MTTVIEFTDHEPTRQPQGRRLRVSLPTLCACLAALVISGSLCGCGMIGPLVGAALPYAGLKVSFACIPAGTSVDTPSGPRGIEKIEPGDSVIGFSGKAVRVLQKHSYLESPDTVFLRVTFEDGAAVDLCGMHRLDGLRARELRAGQTVAGRRISNIQSRRGETRSFDLLTEDSGYRISGVPVNSMIEEMNLVAARGWSAVEGAKKQKH